ncbi:MAG: DUF5329 family protein [Gammaproteobacteria bacterium]
MSLVIGVSGEAQAAENLQKTIKHLLAVVANSNHTFIRNGEAHTGKEAAQHMQAKYKHFKHKIKTPEDFIRLAASKSIMSGRPYLVKIGSKEIRADRWLLSVLEEYRESVKSQEDASP